MVKFIVLVVLGLCLPVAGHAVRGKKLRDLVQQKQLAEEKRKALACQYALLSKDDMRTRLLELMGVADKELAPEDYGSAAAEDHAFKIRVLANELVHKTNSSEKLALEAFQFASEIAPASSFTSSRRNRRSAESDELD